MWQLMPVMDAPGILAGHGKMDLELFKNVISEIQNSDVYIFKNIMYLISKLM